jgi:hypothetical protein
MSALIWMSGVEQPSRDVPAATEGFKDKLQRLSVPTQFTLIGATTSYDHQQNNFWGLQRNLWVKKETG